ncbi:hypothetical protein [Streptomyces aureus]|uniref:Integral membrane protein n=1 Tax=Streptomyces aureus TaxID=193461 RepID=A0ABV4STG7_9ACTN
MTEAFAGSMVTVIPIILVAAAVEIQQTYTKVADDIDHLINTYHSEGPDAALSVVDRRTETPSRSVIVVMALLTASHLVAEAYLILWLAATGHPAHPWGAWFVSITGIIGFSLVAIVALLRPFLRIWKNFPALFAIGHAFAVEWEEKSWNEQERLQDEETARPSDPSA